MSRTGEIISVVAAFGLPYKIRPVKFKWAGKVREIKDVTYTWQTRSGEERIIHFSVTAKDSGSLYELSYNSSASVWRIEAAEEAS